MFKEQMNKIKNLIIKNTKEEDGANKNKKKIENLAFFLIILIITLIIINVIVKDDKKSETPKEDSLYKELAESTKLKSSNDKPYDDLEKRIQDILETIAGVRQSKGTCNI